MKMKSNVFRLLSVLGFAACLASVFAQGVPSRAAQGRKVAGKVGPAVVTIRMVKKNTSAYEGQSSMRETKAEVTAVVIDAAGLAVTSLTSADPSGMYGSIAGDGMSSRSEITDARYLLSDGEEVPAAVVLRDKDLDLLFFRPLKKPAAPMSFVDLKNSAPVDLFDPVILFTRMGKVVNRTLGAKIVEIQGVVLKPRVRYIVGAEDVTDLGCPVMSLDGKTVGLLVVRVARMGTDAMDSMRGMSEGMAPVILTAKDLLKAALQAPEAPAKQRSTSASGTKPTTAPPKKGT